MLTFGVRRYSRSYIIMVQNFSPKISTEKVTSFKVLQKQKQITLHTLALLELLYSRSSQKPQYKLYQIICNQFIISETSVERPPCIRIRMIEYKRRHVPPASDRNNKIGRFLKFPHGKFFRPQRRPVKIIVFPIINDSHRGSGKLE